MNSYELDLDSLYILQSQLTVPTKLAVYFSVKFDEFYLFLNNKKKIPKKSYRLTLQDIVVTKPRVDPDTFPSGVRNFFRHLGGQ